MGRRKAFNQLQLHIESNMSQGRTKGSYDRFNQVLPHSERDSKCHASLVAQCLQALVSVLMTEKPNPGLRAETLVFIPLALVGTANPRAL